MLPETHAVFRIDVWPISHHPIEHLLRHIVLNFHESTRGVGHLSGFLQNPLIGRQQPWKVLEQNWHRSINHRLQELIRDFQSVDVGLCHGHLDRVEARSSQTCQLVSKPIHICLMQFAWREKVQV